MLRIQLTNYGKNDRFRLNVVKFWIYDIAADKLGSVIRENFDSQIWLSDPSTERAHNRMCAYSSWASHGTIINDPLNGCWRIWVGSCALVSCNISNSTLCRSLQVQRSRSNCNLTKIDEFLLAKMRHKARSMKKMKDIKNFVRSKPPGKFCEEGHFLRIWNCQNSLLQNKLLKECAWIYSFNDRKSSSAYSLRGRRRFA